MPRTTSGSAPHLAGRGSRPAKRKARKSQALNALEIAEKQNPTTTKIQRHRLGEIESDDDSQPQGHGEERSSKRRKTSQYQDDDAGEYIEGSDGDGNKWHTGVDEDDEDSDLDSDEAFGESDEERFADFAFGGSSKPAQTKKTIEDHPRQPSRKEIDLSEGDEGDIADQVEDDEDVSGDELGSDAVDLATAWDMNHENSDVDEKPRNDAGRKRHIERRQPDVQDITSESGEDGKGGPEEDDTDGLSQLSFSEDEHEDEGRSKLLSFVQGLEARKDAPNETEPLTGGKLSIETLLAASKNPDHRRALKVVQKRESTGPENYTGGIPGKLAPPLAKRQQNRLDRAAAYEKSKETLNRWIDTVKHNRRAEHLSFPIPDPALDSALSTKVLTPTTQIQPLTSLESTIQEIMQESGLSTHKGHNMDDQEQAFEELQTNKMPVEEVQARRTELRKARDLMFREEIRARRIKKIKSKAYRRVHRRERLRLAQDERALLERIGMINSDDEKELNDKRRAEARMGARHRESKWAKAIKDTGRAAWDEDARGGVIELARKDEELRRRMEGRKIQGSDESGGEASDSESGFEDLSDDDDKTILHSRLNSLRSGDGSARMTSKLGSMAFMQRAEAARKIANDEEVDQLRRSLQDGDVNNDDESTAEGVDGVGRTRYGVRQKSPAKAPARPIDRSEFEERVEDDDADDLEQPDQDISASLAASKSNGSMTSKDKHLPKGSLTPAQPMTSSKAQKPQPAQKLELDDATSSSGSEPNEPVSPNSQGVVVTRQEEMVRMLFAGDDAISSDFQREKQETVLEEGDQVVSNALPGWGSWTGAGVSKREAQRNARSRPLTVVKGVSADQRKDAKLGDRVIVNEKRQKKTAKYLASELPHPFESKQQYERSLRLPLGPEWQTKQVFQDGTKPRVLVKQGVIGAMRKPLL